MTVCSSPAPAGLFHPTCALGVSPSRALFLVRSRNASRRPLPSCRSPVLASGSVLASSTRTIHGSRHAFQAASAPAPVSGPPSRPCSTPESVTPPSGCSPRGRHVALLGFAPLQGDIPCISAPASGCLLPRALAPSPSPLAEATGLEAVLAPRSIDRYTGRPLSLEIGCPS